MTDMQHVNELAKLERRKVRRASLFESELVGAAVKKSFLMLNPVTMARNPVMFVTEIGAAVTTLVLVLNISGGSKAVFYTLWVTLILWLTVLFANFAEALAEARGKAQADTLRKTRRKTMRAEARERAYGRRELGRAQGGGHRVRVGR